MKPTIQFIADNFKKFNEEYFDGGLITPTFELMRSKSVFGQFCHNWGAYKIRISTYYDREEKNILNTLIHEMIHQYIRQNNIRDTRPHHGKVFFSIADRINRQGGWHISRCSNDGELQPTVIPTGKTYYLAAFKLNMEGRYFLININKDYVDYYKNVFDMNLKQFSCVVFFTSTDPKYDTMRKCRRKFTGKYISKDEYDAYAASDKVFDRCNIISKKTA